MKEYAVYSKLRVPKDGGIVYRHLKDTLDEALRIAIREYHRGKSLVQVQYVPGNLIIWENGKVMCPINRDKNNLEALE